MEPDSNDEDVFLSVNLIDEILPEFCDELHSNDDNIIDPDLQLNEPKC